MRPSKRTLLALALAAIALLIPTNADAASSSAYLAYKVREVRHESSYKLDPGLTALAQKRAVEYANSIQRPGSHHRPLVEVPCAWGEILGWSAQSSQAAIRWASIAWRHSPTHWDVLSAQWAHYGIGMYRDSGRWYMVVVFAQCRI